MSLIAEPTILAPFEIWSVPLDEHRSIKFNEPLVVQPEVLPPEEMGDLTYWTVEVPELNISAYGLDYDDLRDCIESCIIFGWKHYVRPDDCSLTPKVREIKRNYLNLAEEVVDG